jgi:hypothetical protein
MISTMFLRKWDGFVRALASVGVVAAVLLQASVADAQLRSRSPRTDQSDERPAPNQTRPLPEIVARVQATPPFSGMDYIGVAGFETRTMIYVLRFLDGRQVVVVHVDARSGRILGRTP